MGTQLVVGLDDTLASEPAVVGAKAASLAQLRAAGLPAPDGFVVTSHAWRAMLRPIASRLDALMRSGGESLSDACFAAQLLVSEAALPPGLEDAARDALRRLGSASVAVRSSASAEDQAGASFAGQYDSFLNVPADEAVGRIRLVWASAFAYRAVAYRRMREVPDDAVAMAVLVVPFIDAHASGVLFTCDPATGDETRFRVEAALGLGEGIVAGTVPVDRFVLDAANGDVLSSAVALKDRAVGAAPDGTHILTVSGSRQTAPALSNEELRELWGVGTAITRAVGPRRDVEFCVDSGVRLLQARPVTGLDERPEARITFDDHGDAEFTWMAWGRGPETALLKDLQDVYARASQRCFEATGSDMAKNHVQISIDGFRFARAPVVEDEELAARKRAHDEKAEVYGAQGTSLYEQEIEPRASALLGEVRAFRHRGASLARLVAQLERAVEVWAEVMGDLHWRMAGVTQRSWAERYAEITGEPEVRSTVFLQAIPNTTTRLVRRLRKLAAVVQSDGELSDLFERREYARLDGLSSGAAVSLRSGFARLLREYGLRTGQGFGSSATAAAPTWNMRPEIPLDMIRAYAAQDLAEIDRLERRAARRRLDAVRRTRKALAYDADRLRAFDEALRDATRGVQQMENHNHLMDQSTSGALREAVHRVGTRLVADGCLDDTEDTAHLTLEDMRAAASRRSPADLRWLVRERKDELALRRAFRPPAVIGKPMPQVQPPAPPGDAPKLGRDGNVIRGVASCGGRVTGPARVVLPTPHPPAIRRGDVLVARNAGPEWTPIFPLLGGLVLDQGVVFQHAALVAREYGIPTVIMTRDATTSIRDGQVVTVDGTQGIVELG